MVLGAERGLLSLSPSYSKYIEHTRRENDRTMIATTGLCQKTVLSQRVARQRGMPASRRAHVVTRAVSSSDVDVVQPRAVVRIQWMDTEWRGRGRRIDVHFGEFRRSISRPRERERERETRSFARSLVRSSLFALRSSLPHALTATLELPASPTRRRVRPSSPRRTSRPARVATVAPRRCDARSPRRASRRPT